MFASGSMVSIVDDREGSSGTPEALVRALAEADGNRTRLPALAGTPVLKTGGPTRRPDASTPKDKVGDRAAASLASRAPTAFESRLKAGGLRDDPLADQRERLQVVMDQVLHHDPLDARLGVCGEPVQHLIGRPRDPFWSQVLQVGAGVARIAPSTHEPAGAADAVPYGGVRRNRYGERLCLLLKPISA